MNKKESTEELRAQYELFVFEMDDALELFIAEIEKSNHTELLPLDYSWESLNRIESICNLYFDGEILKEYSIDLFRTKIARYLGETLRKRMGGTWTFCENPKDVSYGFPEIGTIDNMNPEYAYNPFETFRIYQIRRKSGLIRRAVESHLEYTKDENQTQLKKK